MYMIWRFNSCVHVKTVSPWFLQIPLEVYNHSPKGHRNTLGFLIALVACEQIL